MDPESALLNESPTSSTASSDFTDQNYTDVESIPSSPIIITPLFDKKELENDMITPAFKPVLRYQIPKKPKFRIRPPYLMICISIIQIAVHYFGDAVTLQEWLAYAPWQQIQGWRFISYMLLHSNSLHLILNVVIQLVLAAPLEVEQSRLAVGTIYLGGGVCGALGASLLHRKLYLMGASAGVYALLTSHLAHLYLCHGELRYPGWRLSAVLLLAGADIVSYPVPQLLGYSQTGWAAHIAGATAGPLLGLAVFPKQSKRDARGRRFIQFVRLISAISVTLLALGAIFGNLYLFSLPREQSRS